MNYNDMTNAELQQLCEDFELEVPNRATKAQLVEILTNYRNEMNGEDVSDSEDAVDEEPEVKVTTQAQMPRSKKIALQKADLFRKEHVIITDNQSTQTKFGVQYVRWGNTGITGIQTDIVTMGKPQYVRRGALANMKLGTTSTPVVDENGTMTTEQGPRYNIQYLDGLTEKQIKDLQNKQAMRNAGVVI